MISSADQWSKRDALSYMLQLKQIVWLTAGLVVAIASLALLGIDTRLPWIVAIVMILGTPLLIRMMVKRRPDAVFDRERYITDRDERAYAIDVGVGLIGNAVGVGLMVGVYLALGLYPETTIRYLHIDSAFNLGLWPGVLIRIVAVMAAAGVGTEVAFFLRTKEYYEEGTISVLGWPSNR